MVDVDAHRGLFNRQLLDADLGTHPFAGGFFDEAPHQVRKCDGHDDQANDTEQIDRAACDSDGGHPGSPQAEPHEVDHVEGVGDESTEHQLAGGKEGCRPPVRESKSANPCHQERHDDHVEAGGLVREPRELQRTDVSKADRNHNDDQRDAPTHDQCHSLNVAARV